MNSFSGFINKRLRCVDFLKVGQSDDFVNGGGNKQLSFFRCCTTRKNYTKLILCRSHLTDSGFVDSFYQHTHTHTEQAKTRRKQIKAGEKKSTLDW